MSRFRQVILPVVAIVALVVVGFVIGRTAGARGHSASPTGTTSKRSGGTAAQLLARCRLDATFTCYQRQLRTIVYTQNPAVALDAVAKLYETDSFVRTACHPIVHEIGHLAYDRYKSVTTAEQYARETCWSGYHHGIMEKYISKFSNTQLLKRISHLCPPDPAHPYSLAYYNCWHGLGHGLTIRFEQKVFKSLAFCKAISRDWERQSCYSGVFMQNIVADGSGMHQSVDLRPSDPIYPCDKVAADQKQPCFLMQTSYVLRVFKWDIPRAFHTCDGVQAAYVSTCYRSMGRDISGAATLDPRTVVRECALGATAHRSDCIAGAAANAVYDRHGTERADELCKLVLSADRPGCTAAVRQAAATL